MIRNFLKETLLDAADESQNKGDGDPVYLLRHPHGECGAACGMTFGRSGLIGCLKWNTAGSSREYSVTVDEDNAKPRVKGPD